MKTLLTPRLRLRPFCEDDLDDLYEYARSPDVGPWAGWEPHADKGVSAKILASFMEGDEVWAIEYLPHGKVIGSLGLHPDRVRHPEIRSRMVGYVLSPAYWGQGLMTEAVGRVLQYAFEEMGLDIVSVFHFQGNDRSRRVIEKCGFTREGTLRRASYRYDGKVFDSVCYSMTREEYMDARRGGHAAAL